MSELMLDVGLAHELKMAFRRAGFTSAEIKALAEGKGLLEALQVLRSGEVGLPPVVDLEVFMTGSCEILADYPVEESFFSMRDTGGAGLAKKPYSHDPATIGRWHWEFVSPCSVTNADRLVDALSVDGWTAGKWEHFQTAMGYVARSPNRTWSEGFFCLGTVITESASTARYAILGAHKTNQNLCYFERFLFPEFKPGARILRVRKFTD